MSNSKVAIQNLYSEKSEFIIIGLTGRTGSGCSTSAKILSQDYASIGIDVNHDVKTNEDRRNRIIDSYAKSNWKEFKIIEVRNVITTFILEEEFDMLISFIGTELNTFISGDAIKEELTKKNKNFESEFNSMHSLRLSMKDNFERNILNQASLLEQDDVYEFYFSMLPDFSRLFRETLMDLDKDLYYKLFQLVGRNIRKSGHAYISEFNQEKIHILPQRINKLIKILRQRNLKDKSGVRVVIDSLKNPYEISFFKDRYASFYCMALHCDNQDRTNRLVSKVNLKSEDIMRIDSEEFAPKTTMEEQFYLQNIPMCYENSDIHINNIDDKLGDYKALKHYLVKYITLIMHPGIVAPTHIERVMNIAYTAKLNSSCLSRKVGAVVTDTSFSTLSIGWNSTPEGQVGCNYRNLEDLKKRRNRDDYSKFEIENTGFREKVEEICELVCESDLQGRLYSYCFKDLHEKKNQVHTRSLHAEENAFLQLIKSGSTFVKDSKLFTSASPCVLCSKKAYHLGIKEIYYIDQYPDISEDHILSQGEYQPKLIRFNGIIGSAYHKLYSPIVPYKDELILMLEQ